MPFVKANDQEALRQELEANPAVKQAYEALMAYEAVLSTIQASQNPKRRHRLIRKARLTGHGW